MNEGGKIGLRVAKCGLREENLECVGIETWNIWNEENLG